MANRLRGTFLNGIASSITAGNPGTLVLASGLNLAIPSGYYLPIVLNPPPYAQVANTAVLSEIVWTSGTYAVNTTSFTVLRGQEGTSSLGAQVNIPYAVGPTPQDFGLINWIENGDFPSPTISGQFLVSTASGANALQYVSNIPGTQVSGLLNNASISGSQIVGPITESQITNLVSDLSSKAPLVSPALTGVPTAPTAAALTNDTQLATTSYTDSAVAVETSRAEAAEALLMPKANNNAILTSVLEPVLILGTALAATQTIYVTTNSSLIFVTVAAANNWVFNITSTSTVTLNTLLAIGQSITLTIQVTQGSTPYYCTGIEIDGTAQTVHWQGGYAPAAGFPSGIDVYTVQITKTASATYNVLASLTQF